MSTVSNIVKPAKALKVNALRKDLLNQTVITYLYQINSAIEASNKENKNITAVILPTSFNLPKCIDSDKFKTETYFMIASELKSKGYDISIRKDKLLVIQWNIDKSNNVSSMEEYLREISE